LEESITATAISKSTRSEPPPLQAQTLSMDDYRKRNAQQMKPIGMVRPANQIANQIRAQAKNPALQVIRQRPAPRPQFNQMAGQVQDLEAQERESAKMLVILDNGEQRLITFTLPKETCTVQELLDQVGIQVGADSNIECIENPGSEIDYIVKVGNFASRDTAAMTKAAENHIRQQQVRQQQIQSQRNSVQQGTPVVQQAADGTSKSPEPKVAPKFVPGFFAICNACGYSSQDHAKCMRCNRVFHEEPKVVRMTVANQPQKNVTLQTMGTPIQTHKIVTTVVRQSLDKKDQMEALQRKHQMAQAKMLLQKKPPTPRGRGPRGTRAKITVPEIVTLSSEDEDSEESKSSGAKNQSAKKEEVKKPYEPEIVDDIVAGEF
jgi:sentrin-specific protease 7